MITGQYLRKMASIVSINKQSKYGDITSALSNSLRALLLLSLTLSAPAFIFIQR